MSGRRPMRVAFIGTRGVPATFGGIEHHVEEVGSRLAGRGHDVTVYCRNNYVPPGWREYKGMRLARLPTVSSKRLDAIVHSAVAAVRALGKGFDVVHFHALGPGVMTPVTRYGSRAHVVQTIHGLDDERAKWGSGAQALLRGAGWLSARVPDATVVVSRTLADHYSTRYGRTTTYIPNGVERPEGPPPPREIATRFGLHGGDYVLFVGRLVPEKAPDLLLRAFRRVPGDLRLVIAGGSSYTDRYTDALTDLAAEDKRVVLSGYVYGETLAELYANAAVFVLPSLVEGLPLTLLEAAAHGTPVVASAIGPHEEVIGTDGPGHRLPAAGDEGALATAIEQTVAGGPDVEAGAGRLRDRVLAEYSWDRAVDATEALYRRLVDGLR
ncbi:MAG: glycosyltransferase family 4 protein [Acidimicrobiia bacterium]|nr:glycosyltransferase family 4 protein [Acidimicrobiia bacterium]